MSDLVNRQERIVTRCPSCGCQTLFIGSGGHLTCSLLGCSCPSVAERIEELQIKAHRYDEIAMWVTPLPIAVDPSAEVPGTRSTREKESS